MNWDKLKKLNAAIAAAGGVDESNIYYVGKHGADTNSGLTKPKAFLTFDAAITAAIAQTPAADNRFTILCLDAGVYTEDITIPSYVSVLAAAAEIVGNHIVTDNSLFRSFRLVASLGVAVTKSAGAGTATVICAKMVLPSGVDGVQCSAGVINYQGASIDVEGAYGIRVTSSAKVHVSVEVINITGAGIGIGLASAGEIVLRCGNISDDGSGTALYVASTGVIHARITEIDCNTAYNVAAAGAILNLIVSSLTGTETNTGTVNAVIAGGLANFAKLLTGDPTSDDHVGDRGYNDLRYGRDNVVVKELLAFDADLVTGDGKGYFVVPAELNGMNLTALYWHVYTVSSSGLPSLQVHNLTQAADMCTTNSTIDANENDSKDAAVPVVIDTDNDDVATGDVLRFDIDAAGTGTKGCEIRMTFRKP